MNISPDKIQLNKSKNILVIHWIDGVTTEYGWDSLRNACPCAECKQSTHNDDKSDEMVFVLKPAPSATVESVELVGNYALKIFWNDGHGSGIYSWEYLRKMTTS